MTLEDIKQEGVAALWERLGPADYRRFIDYSFQSSGDYTQDRVFILGNPAMAQLAEELDRFRSKNSQATEGD